MKKRTSDSQGNNSSYIKVSGADLEAATPPPQGTYLWRVLEALRGINSRGDAVTVRMTLELVAGEYSGRKLKHAISVKEPRLLTFLKAVDLFRPEMDGFATEDLVGKTFRARVVLQEDDKGQAWTRLDHFECVDGPASS